MEFSESHWEHFLDNLNTEDRRMVELKMDEMYKKGWEDGTYTFLD